MKKINWSAMIFSIVFLLMLVVRLKSLEVIDIIFYALATIGFIFVGIAPLFSKNKK